MSIQVKHEFVVLPHSRCPSFADEVTAFERDQVRAQEIAFDELPAFFRELPSWRGLARHRLPGVRRSYSFEGLPAGLLAAALGERLPGLDVSWLESAARILAPAEVADLGRTLHRLTEQLDGPAQVVFAALDRHSPAGDDERTLRAALVDRLLAWPDGHDHGLPGQLVELLRSLCAAVHDAGERSHGLLYLSYSYELTPF